MKVTLFRHMILISIGFFYDFTPLFSPYFLFRWTRYINHSRQSLTTARRIFNSISSLCLQLLSSKRSFVFKILLCTLLKTKTDFLQPVLVT